jgi:GNAT superfamily N-acetyltransferase
VSGFVAEPLSPGHDVARFDSGRRSMDVWLREHSCTAAARDVSRTFVWHRGDDVVVGYYTLAAHQLDRSELSRSTGHGLPAGVPSALLARLAVDASLHGRGIGGALLAEAEARLIVATSHLAARFVVVDAIDERAAGFYEHHTYRRLPASGPASSVRLVRRFTSIRADHETARRQKSLSM